MWYYVAASGIACRARLSKKKKNCLLAVVLDRLEMMHFVSWSSVLELSHSVAPKAVLS